MTGALPEVRASAFEKGRRVGSGGQGTVWSVERRRINGVWPVVYKEYVKEARDALDPGVLRDMVAFLPAQDAAVGQWLAEHTAWPAQVVTDEPGRVTGFLMRELPRRFFRTLAFDPGATRAAGFEFLLNSGAYLKSAGIELSDRQRFQLLHDLAGTLRRLHELGVAVGDFSPKNVYFALDADPGCFLIDCDAAALGGRSALTQVETPDWQVPKGERLATPRSDVHKFGLLAVRLFAGDQHTRDPRALAAADARAGRLAEQSLHATPEARPALAQWVEVLGAARERASTTPSSAPPATPTATAPTVTATVPGRTVPRTTPTTTVRTPPRTPPRGPAPQPRTPPAPPRFTPQPPPPRRSKAGPRVAFAAVAVVVGLVAYAVVDNAGSGAADPSSPSSGASGGSSAPAGREAQARSVSGLLARNQGNRGSVGSAVTALEQCRDVSSARRTLVAAAESREALLRDLDGLSLGELPGTVKDSLAAGWKASAEADRAYAAVAEEVSGDCSSDAVTSSSHWDDAMAANTRATDAKKEFVAGWTPIAGEYGLDTVQEGQV
ncbi:hypothetical protein ABT160_12395 [Streptomyces sp. NPDC001941]|uniref:hypothetical protein n=1 Tax=Streptomyces sp. NPDC001941 TaxID=3154659 RepID=UPI00332226A7